MQACRGRGTGTSLSRAVLCTRLNLDESGLTVSEVFIGARFSQTISNIYIYI